MLEGCLAHFDITPKEHLVMGKLNAYLPLC